MKWNLEVVRIEWVDSCSDFGWKTPDANTHESHIVSVGILVGQDKDKITISNSRSEFGRHLDMLTIPKCAITSMRKVKL